MGRPVAIETSDIAVADDVIVAAPVRGPPARRRNHCPGFKKKKTRTCEGRDGNGTRRVRVCRVRSSDSEGSGAPQLLSALSSPAVIPHHWLTLPTDSAALRTGLRYDAVGMPPNGVPIFPGM